MTSGELRSGFLNFFQKRGHKIVPSSSLIPDDPSVLFTTAGMQQFKKYFLGEKDPKKDFGSRRTASVQKAFRTSDIDEVGDESHLTFFEMLGHFSFGDYFKKETIEWTFEFLTKVLKISVGRLAVTVFEGDDKIPFDEESYKTWLKFLPETQIKKNPRKDNVWGPAGDEGPCGAANEVYIDGLEVATLVFMEYFCAKNGSLAPLPQKGVDVGWGLERLAMIAQGKLNVFETDLFSPIISQITGKDQKAKRIIADHIKGAVFLISEGIPPSNVERGYVLRRVLRRAISFGKLLNLQNDFFVLLVSEIVTLYKDVYPDLLSKQANIIKVIHDEFERFKKVLEDGTKEMGGISIELKGEGSRVVGFRDTLRIEQSSGVPLDIQKEFFARQGLGVQQKEHELGREKHREISRAGAINKFGGGGEFSPKLHTATHLLHAALREILGKHVQQMGSDITLQRLRFDFSHPQKMTAEELRKVEDTVNEKIKEDIEVKKEEMPYQEALKSGALAFFKEKYPEKVTVYSIGGPSSPSGQVFSKEICAGPHVKKTGELGRFKIIKEESSGAGIRRIRAVLDIM